MTPNLFLVGFQKCGSSTLFSLLDKHPDIIGSIPKETFTLVDKTDEHYLEKTNIQTPNFEWDSFFPNKKEAKFYMEASVCNFYQNTALEYIAKLPRKKVIFIVRDPIQRFNSAYEYYAPRISSIGPITSPSTFFELLSSEKEKIDVAGARYAVEHGKYVKYIQEWEKAIGHQNLYVVGFRNLIKSTEMVIAELCKFLEIEPQRHMAQLEHKNKTKLVQHKKFDYYTRKLFGGTGLGRTYLGSFYQKINSTKLKSSVETELQQKLKEVYCSEYKNLSTYF